MAFPTGYTLIAKGLSREEARQVASNAKDYGRSTKVLAGPDGWRVYSSNRINKRRQKKFGMFGA